MNPYYQTNASITTRKVPFNDRTNFVPKKGVDLLRKTDSRCRTSNNLKLVEDSKFTLNTKVHVGRLPLNCLLYKHNHIQCIAVDDGTNFVSNKGVDLLHKTDSRYRAISEDSKFKLNAKVHVQRLPLNSLPYKHNHIQCIANDPKFKSNVKVHLERLDLINSMPNSPSKYVTVKQSASNKNVTKAINNSLESNKNVLFNKASKNVKQVNKQKHALDCNKTNTNLRVQEPFVKITRCKELEQFLQSNKRLNKNYVHFGNNKCIVTGSQQHVPVYLQDTNKRSVTKNDPYEFTVSPSKQQRAQTQLTTKKRGRPRKIKNVTDSNGITYDKDIYNVRKVIRQKVIKKATCRIRKITARNKTKNVNNNLKPINSKIKNIEDGLANNVNINSSTRRKQFHPNNSKRILNTLGREIQSVSQRTADTSAKTANFKPRLSTSDMFFGFGDEGDDTEMYKRNRGNFNENVRTLNVLEREIQLVSQRIADTSIRNAANVNAQLDDSDTFFGFVDEEDANDILTVSFVAPTRGMINSIKPTCNANSNKFISLTSTPLPKSQRYSQSPRQFENQKNNSKQIHIISNILIPPLQPTNKQNTDKSPQVSTSGSSVVSNSQNTPFQISFGFDSKLNSTSVCSPRTRRRIVSKPWRGANLSLTRNPHWLVMKDTSLPCYNQEMVKLLEMPNASKTPRRTEESQKQTNVVQSSIIDFIDCNKRSPAKMVNNSSLFDYDDFSPIKNKNKSPNKRQDHLQTPKSVKVKKNILNEIENNTLSPYRRSDEVLNVENYFGFDGPDSETEKENRIVRRKLRIKVNKKEEARPMRVPLEQLKRVRDEAVEELLDKVNLKEVANDEALVSSPTKISANNEAEEEVAPVGLFEDLEQAVKPTYRSYEPKRRKRVRLPSVQSDEDIEEQEVKPKRKRKDVRNHAEEEEFVKWAAAFNAMCDEVEKHSLEIDSTF